MNEFVSLKILIMFLIELVTKKYLLLYWKSEKKTTKKPVACLKIKF